MAKLIEVEWGVPDDVTIDAHAFDTERDANMAGFGHAGKRGDPIQTGFYGGEGVKALPSLTMGASGYVNKYRRRQRRK